MQVIDPHVHFWALGQGNQPWLEHPTPNLLGDYSPMARDFGPEQLLAACGDIELLGMVHVEADALDPLAETRWLTAQLAPYAASLPWALVVGADLAQAGAGAQLEAQCTLSDRVRGVRQILNVHDDPRYDYVGRHYMEEAGWRENVTQLEPLELSFDLQIYPSQMAQAARLASEHPWIRFILNHAGMYVDRQGVAGWRAWRDGLRLLAAQDNVTLKLSGFGMLDHRWTLGSIRPLVLEALDAFGIGRCMFASNYPVDGLYARYQDIWHAYAELVTDASADEKRALFIDNARRVYRL
ncbi:Predicted metal-dependent hydrolase, TIM-barrel fold [Franzmannia pantelleriensis]|uniref:Predicted metal-dependent hydrolase, TIM-barrel fold n=1 Tax=Franzmannia pantelleriensis TaxID=48727 RepID=A0A1G9R402_9GAMM|nr:amidohydrolase family protein [Halomonas pantelleriensis]SDM17155.1 Predicted metal-dependent hydrolase, TIM-barrel fold [Halomonas pantelleriensis]